VLVDGFLSGMWRMRRHRENATLVIETDGSWTTSDQTAVADEGARLLTVLAADAQTHEVLIQANR
jgi:hypothetical protein